MCAGGGGGGRVHPRAGSRAIPELRRAAPAAPGTRSSRGPALPAPPPLPQRSQITEAFLEFKGFLQQPYNLLKNTPTNKKSPNHIIFRFNLPLLESDAKWGAIAFLRAQDWDKLPVLVWKAQIGK